MRLGNDRPVAGLACHRLHTPRPPFPVIRPAIMPVLPGNATIGRADPFSRTTMDFVVEDQTMDRIGELICVLDDQAVIARSLTAKGTNTCKICGRSAESFRSPFSELEYSISAICQACQDYYYLEGGYGGKSSA